VQKLGVAHVAEERDVRGRRRGREMLERERLEEEGHGGEAEEDEGWRRRWMVGVVVMVCV
jgi:hypothetical protein